MFKNVEFMRYCCYFTNKDVPVSDWIVYGHPCELKKTQHSINIEAQCMEKESLNLN